MQNEQILWGYLATQINLTIAKAKLISSLYPDLSAAFKDRFKLLPDRHKWVLKLQNLSNYVKETRQFFDSLQNNQVNITTFQQQSFPSQILQMADYPAVLFYQGDITLLKYSPLISVVGSRIIDNYGRTVMAKILQPLCELKIGVVSGLALGVDGLSHEIALSENSPTIAVIGSGHLDSVFYPRSNISLKKRIINQNGLVISQYPPKTVATPYNFPERNKLIAALTNLTLVVAAGLRSGSLITAGIALELGKIVATIPASILDKSYSGNLKLIKEGACVISEPSDIKQLLGLSTSFSNQNSVPIVFNSKQEEKVFLCLTYEPVEIEIICKKTGYKLQEIQSHLTMLELSGVVLNAGENFWQRAI